MNDNYKTMTGFITGNALYSLYDKWGPRLLERNVRAFLQVRSKVNRGLRDTITKEPDRFLAYNNGLTITAESIEAEYDKETKTCLIKSIKDFQIVNGGQTCASLWHAKEKQNAPLESINVMMKLSIFKNKEMIDEITPKISQFSNSQNPVTGADFKANDPFHIELEKVSTRIFAPDPTGGGQQTQWFYERSRGSFNETRNRERTPARIRSWNKIHPVSQKFDKLLLAKTENTWAMIPYVVSQGAQKNFSEYSRRIQEQKIKEISETDFNTIIARIILWKNLNKIIARQQMLGYRANIITYTLSWFYKKINRKIDFEKIWKKQTIDDDLYNILDEMSIKVREHITDTQYNVTEWCKKEECWKGLLRKRFSIPDSYKSELVDTSVEAIGLSNESQENIKKALNIPASTWKQLSRWGKLTNSLAPWERGIPYSIGKRISKGKEPSYKQAKHGVRIYDKAIELGFNPDEED